MKVSRNTYELFLLVFRTQVRNPCWDGSVVAPTIILNSNTKLFGVGFECPEHVWKTKCFTKFDLAAGRPGSGTETISVQLRSKPGSWIRNDQKMQMQHF